MSIKTAVLGPLDLVQKTIEEGKAQANLQLINYGYTNDNEIINLIKEASINSELILFTGPIPYYAARKVLDINLPMIYVSYSGTAFYKVLFSFFETKGWIKENNINFSIDTIQKDEIEEVMGELNIQEYKVNALEYEDYIAADKIVDFHYKLYKEKKICFSVTCVTSAYDRLKALGVPVYRIVPTLNSIREALKLASLQAESINSKKAQLCVGALKIPNWSSIGNYSPSEYAQQRMRLTLSEIFIDFCENIKASMKFVNEDEYVFYATRGSIENITENYKYIPIIDEINKKLPFTVCIGLGYGYNGSNAEKNSQEALKYALSYNKNSCYVVMEDGKVVGPLEEGKNLQFYAKSQDEELLKIAEKSGVSIITLNKIAALMNNLNKDTITANEIAENLNITLRSARRILSALVEAGLAESVGEEQPSGRGRPRQIFKINYKKNSL